ncbi:MAG: M3 family metallopeptidase [Bdellovibrionota bacterium]
MAYTLPQKPQKRFLPTKFNPLHKKDVIEIIHKLIQFPPTDFKTAQQWFGTYHELSCAVSEAQAILELNINLDNTNKNLEKKLLEFEQNILNELLLCREKMMDIYLSSPFKYSMHAFEQGKIEKELGIRKKFSIPELSSLQLEENKLIREYKHFTNLASTQFEGQTVLLSAVSGKMHDLNERTRKDAFFAYWNFIQSNEQKYQTLFDELLHNRRQQATVSGCKNYTEIAFAELGRFDYGTSECALLRNSISKVVVPCVTQISLKQEVSLAPWNAQVWPSITPTVPPAHGSRSELINSLQKLMIKIHPMFGKLFEEMLKNSLIDAFPRQGKSPGAFSVTFQESGVPFLFGNFGVNLRDMFTFIHEFGHCLHGFAVTNIDNILLRHPGFEFCELASIGLELLASPFLNLLWLNPNDAKNAHKYQLFQMLQFWPFMAMMDEWQHTVYVSEKFLTAPERNELWLQISKKYKPHVNWDGCLQYEKLGWLSRPHIYTSPFYFIDYGIAQIGALQLWLNSKQNYPLAVQKYISGISLGAQLSIPDLFKALDVRFDFSEELINKLCNKILNEINN